MITKINRSFGGRFIEALTSASPYGLRLSLFCEAATRDMRTVDRKLTETQPIRAREEAFEAGSAVWVWEGLDKRAFLSANASRIREMLVEVNGWSADRHGAGALPLTSQDLAVLIYCEAGFRNGAMDAHATHSLGERGLLPLPSNLSFWIGESAPGHGTLLALPENVALYALYLASIKNRSVRSSAVGMLYTELFRADDISDHTVRSAKLMAGVIHGYFLDMNYRGGKTADPVALMTGYQADLGVDDMLAGTGYVHLGTTILSNRQRNIDAAVRDFPVGL